jgi:hypothetical protein
VITVAIILILLALFVPQAAFLLWFGIGLLVLGLILNLVPINGTRRRYY